jgi:hypothetical protein
MAQLPAVFDWSAVACTLRRPQSVAPEPEYSCSFCCTASADFGDDGVALEDTTGSADLLQAVRQQSTRIRVIAEFFMTT